MEPDLTNFDIALGDHQQVLPKLQTIIGEENIIPFIRSRMAGILIHYIECTRGACYNTKFKELIQPYLNDPELLDKVLRSEVIKDKPGTITGKSGARIFPDLLNELRKCKASVIRNYLDKEFAN